MKIEELHLSPRTYNCLKRAGIDTLEQLRALPTQQLLELRGMGPVSFEELQRTLDYLANEIPQQCKGCKNVAFRIPWPTMYPCNVCRRAHAKDYYEHEEECS